MWLHLPWVQRFRDIIEEQHERMFAFATDEVPLRSMRVHATLMERLRPTDVLVFDGGDYAYYGRAIVIANPDSLAAKGFLKAAESLVPILLRKESRPSPEVNARNQSGTGP